MIDLSVRLYRDAKNRTIGLIGQNKAKPMMFLTRFGIHTFGVKFPIDVIILNRENKVVKIREHLNPSSLFFWPLKYNKVIELPAGSIRQKRIKIGSKINLKMPLGMI